MAASARAGRPGPSLPAPARSTVKRRTRSRNVRPKQVVCIAAGYDTLFDRYLRLYAGTADVVHELAADQRGA